MEIDPYWKAHAHSSLQKGLEAKDAPGQDIVFYCFKVSVWLKQ